MEKEYKRKRKENIKGEPEREANSTKSSTLWSPLQDWTSKTLATDSNKSCRRWLRGTVRRLGRCESLEGGGEGRGGTRWRTGMTRTRRKRSVTDTVEIDFVTPVYASQVKGKYSWLNSRFIWRLQWINAVWETSPVIDKRQDMKCLTETEGDSVTLTINCDRL